MMNSLGTYPSWESSSKNINFRMSSMSLFIGDTPEQVCYGIRIRVAQRQQSTGIQGLRGPKPGILWHDGHGGQLPCLPTADRTNYSPPSRPGGQNRRRAR